MVGLEPVVSFCSKQIVSCIGASGLTTKLKHETHKKTLLYKAYLKNVCFFAIIYIYIQKKSCFIYRVALLIIYLFNIFYFSSSSFFVVVIAATCYAALRDVVILKTCWIMWIKHIIPEGGCRTVWLLPTPSLTFVEWQIADGVVSRASVIQIR